MSAQTITCGDARKLARQFTPTGPTVVITEPVAPNRDRGLAPGVDAFQLLRTTLTHLIGKVSHVVILVGCTTDPRFFLAVPRHWPFWRACWLPYVCPVMGQGGWISADVAMVFGRARVPEGRIAPGESPPTKGSDLDHVRWVVRWFSRPDETVLDPFCGAGTTLIAAQEHHRDAVGWDVDGAAIDRARRALRQLQIFDGLQAGDGP